MANIDLWGFIGLQHLMGLRIDEADVETMETAIVETLEKHNQVLNALMAGVVERTTEWQWRQDQISTGTLQPLDEWGNPLPRRHGSYYTVGLPIDMGGDAFGTNRVTRALMTVQDYNRELQSILINDINWMRRRIMSAWFKNTNRVYQDELHGDLTVLPLANGDAVTYQFVSGTSATDNHFLAQANAISNTDNPFPIIYEELAHHPDNSGPFIAYVPSDLADDVAALTELIPSPDPDIRYSTNEPTLRESQFDPDVNVYGPGNGFGTKLIGKTESGVWVREWPDLPANYIVAHAVGAGPFIGMREYGVAALQGLTRELDMRDGNTRIEKFIRMAGFGVTKRTAAVAYRIGNASYAIPAGFDSPLAV